MTFHCLRRELTLVNWNCVNRGTDPEVALTDFSKILKDKDLIFPVKIRKINFNVRGKKHGSKCTRDEPWHTAILAHLRAWVDLL